jgi:hypothetical protein
MNPFIEPGVSVYHNTKARVYPDGRQKITICSQAIFKSEYWERIDEKKQSIAKPKNPDSTQRSDSLKRAKEKVYDIAMLNDFTWFVTWTLDSEKVNRYEPKEVSKKLQQFLHDRVKRNGARYLVIPEHHKDGAIHMHGLLSGDFQMVDSGHRTNDGKVIYNMPQWSWGFSTAIELDDQRDRVSKYITKYITKDFKMIFGNYYYAGGHGLVRNPVIKLYDTDYDNVSEKEYCPGNLQIGFKYINTEV